MSYNFPGAALITGAGGTGIGSAVAKAFASSNCTKIAITDLNPTTLKAAQDSLLASHPKIEIVAIAGDISSATFVDSLISQVVAKFGRIDYAVNCAGVLSPSLRSHETPVDVFDQVNGVNYKGCWLSSRAEITQMLEQEPLDAHAGQRGAIVNIASQLGIVARSAAAVYCASKAAVINMTRSDAIDYSRDNIRVNCVCPGIIDTPMTTGTDEIRERLQPSVQIAPMNRIGRPEEIASAVLFLCSSAASFVQGHAMVVDGGYTIN